MLNNAPPGAFPDAYRLLPALLESPTPFSPGTRLLLSCCCQTVAPRRVSVACRGPAGLSKAPPQTRRLLRSGLTASSLSIPASNHLARRLLLCVYYVRTHSNSTGIIQENNHGLFPSSYDRKRPLGCLFLLQSKRRRTSTNLVTR
ncbi:hypothetical protein NDU88_006380 [Pleurodeles waltl]|uniref:Uncharacterized protein n=1 Tax=Pleurodeles waltl TaxID=8319 RepID=A0AAV7MZ38_PLEWA|nr:hypothetical protein NDU88_006380 [Pleurodeles waltl]